ncbi:MAG: Nramp family divalent metal transporter [Planctomycetota bacterium]
MIGPGLAIAATGVGAGDMVAAAVSGSRFGLAIAWAALVGALLKFTVNEGLARWQLATGTTLLEGWVEHFGRGVKYLFLVYLIVWSFIVAGALISACGLAGHALVPALSVRKWGAIHSVAAAVLVLVGGYAPFERAIKLFIGLMFVTLVGCSMVVAPPLDTLGSVFTQAAVPRGGMIYVLGVIGGVGGTVTLLSYGYWIREKHWAGPRWLPMVRLDLAVAYVLTGIFGLAVIVLAAEVLHTGQIEVQGSQSVVRMAAMLEQVIGPAGRWTFLVGFWGAVATSMLGVWQGVPYLFADFVGLLRRLPAHEHGALLDSRSAWYRGALLWLCLPPLSLMFFEPVGLIVVYSVLGALFMPFLAGTLLYMNSRTDWVGGLKSGWRATALLLLCLGLFGFLALDELRGMIVEWVRAGRPLPWT